MKQSQFENRNTGVRTIAGGWFPSLVKATLIHQYDGSQKLLDL